VNAAAAAGVTAERSAHEPDAFARLFEFVEEALSRGDDEIRKLITWGFLEDLQHYLLRGVGNRDALLPLLGPRSKEAWAEVEERWGNKA
jgi:hypothetical protein